MSAPMGAGRSVDIALQGYVTLQDVCSHVGEIWRRARQQQGLLFALDSSAVLDFSALSLTALARLRKHLREFNCDLALVRCSPSVLERRDDPLLAPLLCVSPPEEYRPADGAPLHDHNRLACPNAGPMNHPASSSLPAPHSDLAAPHHVQWLVRSYQRYWLN